MNNFSDNNNVSSSIALHCFYNVTSVTLGHLSSINAIDVIRCWGYLGTIFGTILGLSWDYLGTILGLSWDYLGTILGLSWD